MKRRSIAAAAIVLTGLLLFPLLSSAQQPVARRSILRIEGTGPLSGVDHRRAESAAIVTLPPQLAPAQPSAGLVINGVFDSSITSDPNAAAIEAAINSAIARYQLMFTDPITVRILFRYSTLDPMGNTETNALGYNISNDYSLPWATVINQLTVDARSANDGRAIATLPSGVQTANIQLTGANGRALGLNTPGVECKDASIPSTPQDGCDYDSVVTLVPSAPPFAPFSFTRPLPHNTYDAQMVVEHEIDEVLGTPSGLDDGSPIPAYMPLDLWTWSSAGTRNVTKSGPRYLSLDSGATKIVGFNQDPDGDSGDFEFRSCSPADALVQNMASCPDQSADISPTSPEGILLDVIGYDPAAGQSSMQFSAANFNVSEGGGNIDVTVIRTGDTSLTSTVDYSTFDQTAGAGHASQSSDYEISVGTLTFAPGETSKTFRVLIVDDKFVEGNETLGITLSNPSGTNATLGSPSSATITIVDNDSVSTGVNPYDDARFFVRQNYLDFLNREPDQSGWDFWTNEITQCGSNAQCIEVKRINVSAAFFLSIEFKGTGLEAYLMHRAAFGPTAPNSPVPVLYTTFMHDVQELGKGYVFGAPGADAVLEANKQAYFAEFVNRPEFLSKYPASLSSSQFVDALLTTAGLPTTGSFRDSLVTKTRADALRTLVESSSLQSSEFNKAFVAMEYFGYLRRDPDSSGYNFWLGKLNDFGGNYIAAEMVKAFISSTEVRQRFGNP